MTSVAEDEVLRLLVLLRNFAPGWKQVSEGGWNVAEICHRSYDLMDKVVGTVGAGRIGQELMQRLKVNHFNSFSWKLGTQIGYIENHGTKLVIINMGLVVCFPRFNLFHRDVMIVDIELQMRKPHRSKLDNLQNSLRGLDCNLVYRVSNFSVIILNHQTSSH